MYYNVTGIYINQIIESFNEHELNLERFVKNSLKYIKIYNVKYSPKLWMYYTYLECAERKKCKLFLMSDRLALVLYKKNLKNYSCMNFSNLYLRSDRELHVAWLVVISTGRDIVPNVLQAGMSYHLEHQVD